MKTEIEYKHLKGHFRCAQSFELLHWIFIFLLLFFDSCRIPLLQSNASLKQNESFDLEDMLSAFTLLKGWKSFLSSISHMLKFGGSLRSTRALSTRGQHRISSDLNAL